jgi:hypothetical protein
MSAIDRILVVKPDGALLLSEAPGHAWGGRAIERPISLRELHDKWPKLFVALIEALQQFPKVRNHNRVFFD